MVFKQKVNFPFEVIVIDSGSTDGTLDFLKGHYIRLKQISPEEFNHGLTRNMSIELAQVGDSKDPAKNANGLVGENRCEEI